jgi:hypothetical protein
VSLVPVVSYVCGACQYLYTTLNESVQSVVRIHTQGVSRSVFCRLGLVLGAHGALADLMLGAQHFYFTTGLLLMHLYYIIGNDREHRPTKQLLKRLGNSKRIAFYLKNCVLTHLDSQKTVFE